MVTKEKKKEYARRYYIKHKKEINRKNKENYNKNKEKNKKKLQIKGQIIRLEKKRKHKRGAKFKPPHKKYKTINMYWKRKEGYEISTFLFKLNPEVFINIHENKLLSPKFKKCEFCNNLFLSETGKKKYCTKKCKDKKCINGGIKWT